MKIKKIFENKSILSLALVTITVLALGIGFLNVVAMPSSKWAIAGSEAMIIRDVAGVYPNIELLDTRIKLPEAKDLVISFTAECVLVTDTKIKGKGSEEVSSEDRASIVVWVEVDGVKAFPEDVTFAERIQILKGRLSAVTHEADGTITFLPEELELILDTTSANGFNFIMLNVGSGEHEVKVYATIELVDDAQPGVVESYGIAGAIGDRTLIVGNHRFSKDAEL
jgi:hypothetical protein